MTARIRVQFDEGQLLLDLPEMPRIGEGIILPSNHDPAGHQGVSVYRVIDVAQYTSAVGDLKPMPQRADVRVRGSLSTGPRDAEL